MSDDTGRILAAIAELEVYAEHGLASVDLASAPITAPVQGVQAMVRFAPQSSAAEITAPARR